MFVVKTLQYIPGESPDEVADRSHDHQIESERQQEYRAAFIGQNKRGEHSQPIDDDFHINKLQKNAHGIGGFFLCVVLHRWETAKRLIGKVEQIRCSDICHDRADTGDNVGEGTAEDAAKAHQSKGTGPDSQHKFHIFAKTIFAGGGQK